MEFPVLIYDNLCTSCTDFAKIANVLLRGKITMIGHYTKQGEEFKKTIFPENYDGTEMSWFVTEKKAYGGRKVLQQIIGYMFSPKHITFQTNFFDLTQCNTDCKTIKGVFFRSCSILTNSKIIEY
jgi:hypothetical protein